ncbi:hypothetical protein ABW16_01660 [Mycolicibacter heraklionensis]|uniref:Uncharacterized protein n=1 Tax=Mycolicibacter heraklionensis TaxID=512402 RepID=A0ABR5FKP1_9MYCO|nr:hypothetical protein [Mycolicibacter heraklionensis]KLO31572.1 hypothetical protein ABW16_01660 [Mycolicibacter heraklionensis]
MTADQDVFAHLGGVGPDGSVLGYQYTPEALGRCTYGNADGIKPYQTEFTPGHPVVGSAATYDQVTADLRLQGGRHVDPLGNVADPKKAWLLQWYWMLDGCPTPLSRDRLWLYIQLASELRPWPTSYAGAMDGEPTADYSSVDPTATLDELT